MKILADASLPYLKEAFHPAFELTRYHSLEEIKTLLPHHNILLCRSTLKVTANLLEGSQIQCVATASSGNDHIDKSYLARAKISLFDAKGCNADAVADYVVTTLACLEKQEKLRGKIAGLIGVGHVGKEVHARLQALGFEVICYDPPKALVDKTFYSCAFKELTRCDLLCIHANLHETPPYPSAHLLNKHTLEQLKSDVIIINTARGGIINEEDLLKTSKITYCTDVYSHEPNISDAIINRATLCTPHIAGHTIEAKNKAVFILSQKLHQHYRLDPPQKPSSSQTLPSPPSAKNWQAFSLSVYDPSEDTKLLKKACGKKAAFLTQRDAHHRHSFGYYQPNIFDPRIRSILGISTCL
jgi:erythronate-4-phosphate dehydrogenase